MNRLKTEKSKPHQDLSLGPSLSLGEVGAFLAAHFPIPNVHIYSNSYQQKNGAFSDVQRYENGCGHQNSLLHTFHIPMSPAAPSIGPTGISSTYVNSTALRLTWKVLQDHELNGVLVRYDVRISGPEDYTRVYNVAPSATTRIIPNLNINTVYGMSVRAVNQAAPGPFSNPVQQRTDEFSKQQNYSTFQTKKIAMVLSHKLSLSLFHPQFRTLFQLCL